MRFTLYPSFRKLILLTGLILPLGLLPVGSQVPPPLEREAAPAAARLADTALIDAYFPAQGHYALLEKRLLQALERSPLGENTGVYVEDAEAPVRIVDHKGRNAYSPAGLQIIVTVAAALDALGPAHRFRTTLSYTGTHDGPTINGNLVLKGTGDPTIGRPTDDNEGDPAAILREWAREVRDLGVSEVAGALVVDDNHFDDELEGRDWPTDQLGQENSAQVSAASFNDNCVDISLKCGRRQGRSPEFSLTPENEYVVFHNAILTGDKRSTPTATLKRSAGSNIIQAHGRLPAKSRHAMRASIHEPTLWFGHVMRMALAAEGVSIVQSVALDIDSLFDETAATSTTPLVVHFSPPLAEIAAMALRERRNLYAECFCKEMGAMSGQEGSFAQGSAVTADFLRRSGIPHSGVRIVDGSGLSLTAALTPLTVVKTLCHLAESDKGPGIEAFASPGDGRALEGWFEGMADKYPLTARRVRAMADGTKTSCALAGYVTTAGGARLAFTFISEKPRLDRAEAQRLFEELVRILLEAPVRRHD